MAFIRKLLSDKYLTILLASNSTLKELQFRCIFGSNGQQKSTKSHTSMRKPLSRSYERQAFLELW